MNFRRLAAGLTLTAAIATGAIVTAPQASADTGWGITTNTTPTSDTGWGSPGTDTTDSDTGWGTPPTDPNPGTGVTVQANDTGWG